MADPRIDDITEERVRLINELRKERDMLAAMLAEFKPWVRLPVHFKKMTWEELHENIYPLQSYTINDPGTKQLTTKEEILAWARGEE